MNQLSSQLLLKVSVHLRWPFFKLWNQIQASDEAYLSPEDKVRLILQPLEADLQALPEVRLDPRIKFISMFDEDYPPSFWELPQPPIGIYVRGNLGNRVRTAVVGSRKPTPYSKRLARELSFLWAKKGYSIVSGGAVGIDGDAHESALNGGGHTIVVLGGGFNKLHPRSHIKLFETVVRQGGALVSEYPPDLEPRAHTFPERNRLIAALSDVLFLAQAHAKSGSLSTARAALEMGREIYVLRPILGDENFAGSQALIDEGAKLLIDSKELEFYEFQKFQPRPTEV